MDGISKTISVVGVALLAVGLSASAHHSFSGQFDRNLPVAFEGIVTKVEWQNPHVWFYVDAEDEDGRCGTAGRAHRLALTWLREARHETAFQSHAE